MRVRIAAPMKSENEMRKIREFYERENACSKKGIHVLILSKSYQLPERREKESETSQDIQG